MLVGLEATIPGSSLLMEYDFMHFRGGHGTKGV
jgi:hypothetical protein